MQKTLPIISQDMKTLLHSIVTSEYHDGQPPVGNPVWIDQLKHQFSKQTIGGLFAQGIRMGLLKTNAHDGSTRTVTLLGLGADALAGRVA